MNTTICLPLPVELKEKIRKRAFYENSTLAGVIRKGIEMYLETDMDIFIAGVGEVKVKK